MPVLQDAPGRASVNLGLQRRLTSVLGDKARCDLPTRGRYATDASIYQILPAGVVFPANSDDVAATIAVARDEGLPVIMRGGGTSQNGQPIGPGIVVDCSRFFNRIEAYDPGARTVTVEPGVVLEHLNARLKADGLFFPVEPSTASRCTIGGMAGNNSCGARSLRYGKMVDNVRAITALTATGEPIAFDPTTAIGNDQGAALARYALSVADRERAEIEARFPKVQRRVGGYNLDSLIGPHPNPAHLLVGSEGTLAAFTSVTLALSPLPAHRVVGVCQFPSFRAAMETTKFLVDLGPTAVELVDNNVLVLGNDIPMFRRTLADITRGTPDCLLVVEFAGDDRTTLEAELRRLDACMSDHGFPGSVVPIVEPDRQRQVWDVREACLNIMMSMKGDAKPVSFIEDCAVPLEHLAAYTEAITDLFARHGTRGTWYAHASVGCLHVRPILDMKSAGGVAQMRAIAEAAVELVRRFEGSFSGEHGDGISRSQFIRPMFGDRLNDAFAEIKDRFDPGTVLNPGKIVRPLSMDDRSLMRYPPGYRTDPAAGRRLDWTSDGGFGAAVEMCNNNGTCRKTQAGVMCPSYRVTYDETHVTRGRANTLRLALSGQLDMDGLASDAVKEALDLCVGCKACKRECPTGVDMARMKIEALAAYYGKHGLPLRERLVAMLPRYARLAAIAGPLLNIRNHLPPLRWLSEQVLGLAADRPLPAWRHPWTETGPVAQAGDVRGDGRDVVLFGDTFNRYFEPDNLLAAERVLDHLGYRLHRVRPVDHGRPLCCGRTFLSAGQIDGARSELARTVATLAPFIEAGARIIGLEPSCMLTFRDEAAAVLPGSQTARLAGASLLVEDLIAEDLETAAGRLAQARRLKGRKAWLHGHCHQKAGGVMGSVERVLASIPGLAVETIPSSCCGMAGAFGYQAEHQSVSRAMAELSLLPAVRKAAEDDIIVADGTSCRHQIADGTGREAIHVVRVLDTAIGPAT